MKPNHFVTAILITLSVVLVLFGGPLLVDKVGTYLSHRKMSDVDLAYKVQRSIEDKYQERGLKLDNITSFIVVNKSGNEYTGILKTQSKTGRQKEYNVNIIYDGENMRWEMLPK